jgi:hypothetical protein
LKPHRVTPSLEEATMLCMQQCIDLCHFSPEEAEAIRASVSLHDIMAIQAECPRLKKADSTDEDAVGCEMLDIRDQLPEEVWADEDCADLSHLAHRDADFTTTEGMDGDAAI